MLLAGGLAGGRYGEQNLAGAYFVITATEVASVRSRLHVIRKLVTGSNPTTTTTAVAPTQRTNDPSDTSDEMDVNMSCNRVLGVP